MKSNPAPPRNRSLSSAPAWRFAFCPSPLVRPPPSKLRTWALLIAVLAVACGAPNAQKPAAVAEAKSDGREGVRRPRAEVGHESAASAAPPAQLDVEPAPLEPQQPAVPERELPRGGRTLFPDHRLVGFCGTPGAPALGRLSGDLVAKAKLIEGFGVKYANGRKPLPVFELIAVVVQGAPGADKKWRRRIPQSIVDRYLQAARAAKALLLLNIQPGHSDFLTEVKELEKFVREPDVGVALDPEWAMKPKQKPGVYYGQTTGEVINGVAEYLSTLVKEGGLPEKPLVFHQVNEHVLKDEATLAAYPGVVFIKSVDGLGPSGTKVNTYRALTKHLSSDVHAGFKLFFDEDSRGGRHLMTPAEVLALQPEPEYVMYE